MHATRCDLVEDSSYYYPYTDTYSSQRYLFIYPRPTIRDLALGGVTRGRALVLCIFSYHTTPLPPVYTMKIAGDTHAPDRFGLGAEPREPATAGPTSQRGDHHHSANNTRDHSTICQGYTWEATLTIVGGAVASVRLDHRRLVVAVRRRHCLLPRLRRRRRANPTTTLREKRWILI